MNLEKLQEVVLELVEIVSDMEEVSDIDWSDENCFHCEKIQTGGHYPDFYYEHEDDCIGERLRALKTLITEDE